MTQQITSQQAQEQELFHRLSKDMRKSLRKIYKDLTTATHSKITDSSSTDRLIEEASAQLSEVVETTKKATDDIMTVIEKQMDLQAESSDIINKVRNGTASQEEIARLQLINDDLGNDLINTMTLLSFQDLTGQRIKKVVEALQNIENTILNLYVSSGVMIKGKEDNPESDFETLKQEAQTAVEELQQKKSELKGPSNDGCSQNDIDDLLSQLGM